jgi:hypothetical protein
MRGDAAHDRFRPLSHASENGFATAKNGFFGTWFGGGGAPLLKSQADLVNSCAASVCGREQFWAPEFVDMLRKARAKRAAPKSCEGDVC